MSRSRAITAVVLPLQISALRLIIVASVLIPGDAPGESGARFDVTEVADGVHVHIGVHASVDDPRHDDIANVGFIAGTRCVAVIDSGGSVAAGRRLLEAIRSRTALPICYVINTHVHYDHVLGNAAFRETPAKFVGHAALADALAASQTFFEERFAEDLDGQPVVGPDILVHEHLQLDLGDRVLDLRAHPAAHTTADLSIYDGLTGTLWLGDLLFMDRTPVLDGSLRGWLGELAELDRLPARRAVPGHGPASAPWPAAAGDQRRYLQKLLDSVREAIARGAFMEDVAESAAWDERGNWLLFDDVHRRNVMRAFTELEWE